ncbi:MULTISPECIES: DUF680 domain-containing protein [unclassified Mesorhizobium]|uniref:DUF680 domain-containing protein n=1 Tax=unclassified Mesorhizobium TaxID=325217 RepID=UPI00301504B6
MKKTALALAAVLALSGSAFATDFAATLQYPIAAPRLDATVASKPAKGLDYSSTGSIKQKSIKSSAQPSGATAQPKAKAK